MLVLKGLILDNSYLGKVWWFLKGLFSILSTLRGFDSLERTDFG